MKVLWFTNIAMPEYYILNNEKPLPYGGWLDGLKNEIEDKVQLSVCFPSFDESKKNVHGNKVSYYPIFKRKLSSGFESSNISRVFEQVEPDIVHIFGTENETNHQIAKYCSDNNYQYIVNIQGIASELSNNLFSGLTKKQIYSFTIRDFLKRESVYLLSKKYKKQKDKEVYIFSNAELIIGRTSWDRAFINSIGVEEKYYVMTEMLRSEFYNAEKWKKKNRSKKVLLFSQANYPVKGLHWALEALILLCNTGEDNFEVLIAGEPPKSGSWINRQKNSYYQNSLVKKIKRTELNSKIKFIGRQDTLSMISLYQNSDVFITPSLCENSSNSICEAQYLGIPTISSYVGGTPSIVIQNESNILYQHDSPSSLAYEIKKMISNPDINQDFNEFQDKHLQSIDGLAEKMIEIYRKSVIKG